MENEYDSSSDRRDYLSNFLTDHEDEPRYSGAGECPPKTWCKDSDNDGILQFETKSGAKYEVAAVYTKAMPDIPDLQFSDESGSFAIASRGKSGEALQGKGEALEVFSKVVPAMVGYFQKKDLKAATFSAAEPSRQRLYNRLVKSVTSALPDYFAASLDVGTQR